MFSRHTAWQTTTDPLALAVAALQRAGRPVYELRGSNPTHAGFVHPDAVYRTLDDPRNRDHTPAALGLASAREAVALYYAERGGAAIDPAQIGLAASTSEIYSYLLALLCDPGDAILVPQPGYPLLHVIAELAHVELVTYPQTYLAGWSIAHEVLLDRIATTPRLRAVVVVSPNNPTGHYLSPSDLELLHSALAPRDLALIVDEVFWDYPLSTTTQHTSPSLGNGAALCFVLSGLSKVAALPQFKLAWWLARGPADLVRTAMARLEIIADTFLSVAAPVQRALPQLLAAAPAIQRQISTRCRTNLACLRRVCHATAMTALDVEAGWLALVRLPAVDGLRSEAWAHALLQHAGIASQPGHLYDLDDPPHVALSLLTPEATFASACDRLPAAVARVITSGL